MAKILYIHHSGLLGGAPRSLSFLLKKINPTRHQVRLICISDGPAVNLLRESTPNVVVEKKMYPFHGSTVVPKGSIYISLVNVFLSPLTFVVSRKHIKAESPQIVHLNSSCLCFCALAAKSVNPTIKVVCHIREPLRKSFFGWLIKKICQCYVDHFVAIDSFSGSSMAVPKARMDIIYNSVDMNVYHPGHKSNVLRKELNLNDSIKIFLYLARIAPGNGTLALVNMAKKVRKADESIHFVIVGLSSANQDEYASHVIAAAEIDSGIHILHFRDDIPDVIASSDVLVVPFTEPHFARSIVEASALGIPSIGANVGGVNELIKHGITGYLYNNEEEFLNQCLELANNEAKRVSMGKDAAFFSRECFDNDRNAERVFQIYERIINEMS